MTKKAHKVGEAVIAGCGITVGEAGRLGGLSRWTGPNADAARAKQAAVTKIKQIGFWSQFTIEQRKALVHARMDKYWERCRVKREMKSQGKATD